MSYKFLDASLSIRKSPKNTFLSDFQAVLDKDFLSASDWFTIKEESPFGSGTYIDFNARINRGINTLTGQKLGDDYKMILFQDLDHDAKLGYLYQFENNYWTVINTETIANLAASCVVRRCNNTLRWLDTDGTYNSVPCIIDYSINENTNYTTATTPFPFPKGTITVFVQLNSRTNKIRPNQRFLFGNSQNWTCYKVEGGGIGNYNNTETLNNASFGFLTLSMSVDYINSENDDLVNGIADANQNSYSISLNFSTIQGTVGSTVQMIPTVKLNGETVTRSVVWSSSVIAKATVNSSGLVSCLSAGSTVITCTLAGNSSVYAQCSLQVIATPVSNYEIKLSPNVNYVLEGKSEVFTVGLYLNGVLQADTFTFSIGNIGNVPTSNYTFNVYGGNSFAIVNNKKYLAEPVEVVCVSGMHTQTFGILLKGAW